MLWIDLQLQKTVNVFPPQLLELERAIPFDFLRNLRPILKLVNTLIPYSDREVKTDKHGPWIQYSICMLERSHTIWETRWKIQEYNDLVEKGNHNRMSDVISGALKNVGVN
jgi:formiminotetrahydrofolate cyclodeaminase